MTEREWLRLLAWYRPLQQRYGLTPEAVGWSSGNQAKRFALLTAGWDLVGGQTVLDVGCGLAHLYDWLVEHKGFRGGYLGVDALPEYVDAANRRIGGGCQVADAEVDALPACDYVVASGVFNVDLGNPTRNREHLVQVATRMAAVARRGMAFDCLLDTHPHRVEGQAYYPMAWVQQVAGLDGFHPVLKQSDELPGDLVVQLTRQEVAHA